MPIHQHKKISDTNFIGVWKITEDLEQLTSNLKSIGFDVVNVFETKNELRLKQWLATRLLLHFFIKDALIVYDDLGKPSLNNGWKISISHSNEYVAIVINKDEDCGVDIEKISSKVGRIKHKYLNDVDLTNVTSEQDLTIYWGAKEALYKYYGKKEVLFIENLFIENFNSDSNSFVGRIEMPTQKISLNMAWEKIDDFVLVYTL